MSDINSYVNAMNGDLFVLNDSGEADVGTPEYYITILSLEDNDVGM